MDWLYQFPSNCQSIGLQIINNPHPGRLTIEDWINYLTQITQGGLLRQQDITIDLTNFSPMLTNMEPVRYHIQAINILQLLEKDDNPRLHTTELIRIGWYQNMDDAWSEELTNVQWLNYLQILNKLFLKYQTPSGQELSNLLNIFLGKYIYYIQTGSVNAEDITIVCLYIYFFVISNALFDEYSELIAQFLVNIYQYFKMNKTCFFEDIIDNIKLAIINRNNIYLDKVLQTPDSYQLICQQIYIDCNILFFPISYQLKIKDVIYHGLSYSLLKIS